MFEPLPRPQFLRKLRNTFANQFEQFTSTLEPGTYPVSDFVDDFLIYFERPNNLETRLEVVKRLTEAGLIENEEVTI